MLSSVFAMQMRREVRRRLEQYAANPACEANVLSAVHDIPMDAVARWLGLSPKVGQSPFAIARGHLFEKSLFENDAARLRKALTERRVLQGSVDGFLDLRIKKNDGPIEDIPASRAAFRAHLTRIAGLRGAARSRIPAIIAGPCLMVPGKAILPDGLFSIDVLTVHPGADDQPIELRVGEIKVYPDRGGFTDSAELVSSRAQAGLYVYALEVELQAWNLSPAFRVARDGFLVLTKPGSNIPSVRAGEDLRFQAERAKAAFERLRQIAARELPIDDGADVVPPRRLTVINDSPTVYKEACLSFCEMADHCHKKGLADGNPAALGEDLARFLGPLTIHRALALLDGAPAENAAEADFLRRAS